MSLLLFCYIHYFAVCFKFYVLVTLYSICLSLSDLYLVQCPPNPAAAAKSLQLCPTLCNPIDGSPPGSSAPGILQARILEWVAISFFNACMPPKALQSCPTLCDLWTAAHQAPLSIEFSRQEYWSGLPFPSPGDLPDPGVEPTSPALQADSLLTEHKGKPSE